MPHPSQLLEQLLPHEQHLMSRFSVNMSSNNQIAHAHDAEEEPQASKRTTKKHLLDLPVEVLHRILLFSTLFQGVQRALRLKLVCKHFKTCLQSALFESRLLDDFIVKRTQSELDFMQAWYIDNDLAVAKFWQSYLLYRVRNERDPEIGRFVEIRQIAEDFCGQTNAEYEKTIDGLCWLALERGVHYSGHRECWRDPPRPDVEAPNPSVHLLSAAAYFGHLPLARLLLSEGHCPTSGNGLFPSPMQLAAWAGNAEMLKLFQEHLLEFEEIPPRFQMDDRTWRGKTGPGAIKGAALSGDMQMLQLAIYPPSRATPDNTDFAGQPWGKVDSNSKPGADLRAALYFSKTWEVFQYIDSFFEKSILIDGNHKFLLLEQYSELGNVEMVQQLLNAGVDVHGRPRHNPLQIAARYCKLDVVDLLLKRGADPNDDTLQFRHHPLLAAVLGDSVAVVRKLFEHGADTDAKWELLYIAVEHQNIAMLELLLEHFDVGYLRSVYLNGPNIDYRRLLKKVSDDGLESMLQVLQKPLEGLPIDIEIDI